MSMIELNVVNNQNHIAGDMTRLWPTPGEYWRILPTIIGQLSYVQTTCTFHGRSVGDSWTFHGSAPDTCLSTWPTGSLLFSLFHWNDFKSLINGDENLKKRCGGRNHPTYKGDLGGRGCGPPEHCMSIVSGLLMDIPLAVHSVCVFFFSTVAPSNESVQFERPHWRLWSPNAKV